MYSENPKDPFDLDAPTKRTSSLPVFVRMRYLVLKLARFLWRYRRMPRYLVTYLFFVNNESYAERVDFMSDKDFIEQSKKRSTLRLQDGEFTLLLGTRGIGYQQKNDRLISMWKEAIENYSDGSPYMLGLPPYVIIENKKLHEQNFKYLWMPAKILYRLWFPKKPKYYNGSYFYINNTSIPFMQTVSRDREVLLVSNKEVIEAVKPHIPNFFKDAVGFSSVETPEENAFAVYDRLLQSVREKVTINTVIFMACGPAGKAMIYDLSKENILAHDIGYGLTGAYTGEEREHFLKWDVFGPEYSKKINYAS